MASGIVEDFRRWQSAAVEEAGFACSPIPFSHSKEWGFERGILRHRSGGFFSLAGIEASARDEELDGYQQLIILQPQVAINGFLMQRNKDGPRLLFQGRIEPGNVGGMQLAPTVQSTPANYLRWHEGRATPFVEYFLDPSPAPTVVDTLQSEEATRYLGKYNRNVVVALDPATNLDLPAQFRWFDPDAIRAFAHADNVLNTDARSVLACLDWELLAGGGPFADAQHGEVGREIGRSYAAPEGVGGHSDTSVFAWLCALRARLGLRTRVIPIGELADWRIDADAVRERRGDLGFVARQFKVVARGREVDEWDQPLIDSQGVGRIGLVFQERAGTVVFLIKASREVGFLEGVQLAPSLLIPPGCRGRGDDRVEARLLELVGAATHCTVIARCRQSEEGGRFFRDENDYELIRLDGALVLPDSQHYRWMTLAQIRRLLRVSGVFSMELRGALSLLLAYV